MQTGIIYRAISPSGKSYVGKTIRSFEVRKREHISHAFNKVDPLYNTKFCRAIRKYEEGIIWEVLCKSCVGELNNLEEKFVNEFNSYEEGYNSTLGGKGVVGLKRDEKSMKKFSRSSMGRVSWNKGKKTGSLSKEHKEKISKKLKGRTFSKEHRLNISKCSGNFKKEIDINVIFEAFDIVGDNQSKVAEFLNVGRRLLRRRARSLGLTWSEMVEFRGVK